MTISEWQRVIHDWAVSKGWWSDAFGAQGHGTLSWSQNQHHRGVACEKLLLIHSEVSEAAEEIRNADLPKPLTDKPEGFGVELADVAIRLFDLCEVCGIDLEQEIANKMIYNRSRPYKHGGKLF